MIYLDVFLQEIDWGEGQGRSAHLVPRTPSHPIKARMFRKLFRLNIPYK